jgi:hypothetical protein
MNIEIEEKTRKKNLTWLGNVSIFIEPRSFIFIIY